MTVPELSLTVNSLLPGSKPDYYYSQRNQSQQGRPKTGWNYKKTSSRISSPAPKLKPSQPPDEIGSFSPRESNISMALEQVMKINVKNSSGNKHIELSDEANKLVTTPRDPVQPFSKQLVFNVRTEDMS